MKTLVVVVAAAALTSACAASTVKATSVPDNHRSATAEDRAATVHEHESGVMERQAGKETGPTVCNPAAAGEGAPICWSSSPDWATSDLMRARDERKDAQEHRRVSGALRAAEAAACAGIADDDLTHSPFAHRDDVLGVETILGPAGPVGSRVRFRAVAGLTAGRLQHVVDCHLARDNALGHDVPEMAYCPLVPRGATATVTAVPSGYLIDVRSTDPDGAREIVRRSHALLP